MKNVIALLLLGAISAQTSVPTDKGMFVPPNVGLCSSYQHPKAILKIDPKNILGNWTTLFVDQAKFQDFYKPSCLTAKFEPLSKDDPISLVQSTLERHLVNDKITEKTGETFTLRFDDKSKPMIGRQFQYGSTNKYTQFLQPPPQY